MVSLPLYDDAEHEHHDDESGCASCEAVGGDRAKCGNGLEKVYKTAAVRYGYMRQVGEFTYADGMKFTCGAKVVIQTDRGIEIGEQISLSCNGCDRHVSREQIKTYIENSGADVYRLENGRILREATPDDLAEQLRLRSQTREMLLAGQRTADHIIGAEKMKFVECEYLLGGERVVLYFMAEGRVDFRNLVRDLSKEFQTRIQMHQVGARDEARLLADFETCGREVCCKVFLKTLKPVTMRMAKLQRSTLDPSKVSGRCGRLKCCLRYEHESYEALDAKLPKIGERLNTAHGYGTVIDRQVLTQLVQIENAVGGGVATVVIEDVLERGLTQFPPLPEPSITDQPPRPQPRERQPRRRPMERPPQARPVDSPSTPEAESGARIERVERSAPPPRDAEIGRADQPPPKRRRGRRRRRPGPGGGEGPPRNGGDNPVSPS